MFRKLLIANRGEVVLRVARAARALGIQPVGVVSSFDRDASWARSLEEVVCIGASAPRESYLRPEALLQAALQTSCSAIHPGWGFLAENARFAALVEQHGITFVGPPPSVIERMGLKWPAKLAMRRAGLAPIPGSEGLLRSVEEAVQVAKAVGWPVLLKADAGGGGRGMRLCRDEKELAAAFPAATHEAEAAFGNGALYLERYLAGGRHIEVQILADRFGKAVHLFERDCSVQRNHQKLIEESPSPALTAKERAELGERAAKAAAAIGYVGAGTMEFLRDATGALWFMEMNTRLQVEHPVTEMLTGIDIVQWQLRIAANQALTLNQAEILPSGAAIECRINAEDPTQNFRPTPGKLSAFRLDTTCGPGRVRVETHLQAGDEIGPHYDSLLAKVITWGEDRPEALETMRRVLASATIGGVATTMELHACVLADPAFVRGDYDTRSIPGWKTASAVERGAHG